MSKWMLSMKAEPVIPAWTSEHECDVNGAELQRAILRGFSDQKEDPVWSNKHREFVFEMTFTFKEHGEFFRGALTMAGLRYAGDFFELLQRYGTIKVTIVKHNEEATGMIVPCKLSQTPGSAPMEKIEIAKIAAGGKG